MKKLLLLTSDYPYVIGDGHFLINEIDALSKSFDKVYIARKKKLYGVEEHPLPDNVELVFSGFIDRKDIIKKGLFNLSKIPVRLFFQELKYLKKLRFFFRFVFAFLFGRALFANKVIRDIISKDKDVVLYSFWGTGMSFIIPFLSDKKPKTVIKLHGGDLYAYRKGYIPFRESIYAKADKIITISEDGKNYLAKFLEKHRISSEKLALIRLGTQEHQKASNLQTFEEKVVVSCSSLIEVKRVDLIYKVLKEASKSLKIRWIHFGDGHLKQKLMQEIQPSNQLIIDFKGNQPNDKLIEFYKTTQVDLFINLSSSEGIPVSIMEAISFNIPILASDAGGTREIVQETHKTGVLVPVDFELQEVKEKLVNILDNKILFEPKAFWNQLYNRDINGEKLIEILHSENRKV